jgi:hypothetical protein
MSNKQNIQRLIGCLVIIGALHMTEQLLFGIQQIYEVKRIFASYQSWFRDPDWGTVLFIFIMGTLLNLIAYSLIAGGRLLLLAVGFFGVQAITEVHHLVNVITHGTYNVGTVTSIPFMAIGVLLLREVVRGWRDTTLAHAGD